jgi:hypothetical protein
VTATKRSGKTGRKQTRREAQIVGDKLRIFDTRFTRQSGEGGRGRTDRAAIWRPSFLSRSIARAFVAR